MEINEDIRVDRYGFFRTDEEVDFRIQRLKAKMDVKEDKGDKIVDLGYDYYDVDRKQLSAAATIMLSIEQFQKKVQELLKMKPRRSILKRVKVKVYRDEGFTDAAIHNLIRIKRTMKPVVRNTHRFKMYHAAEQNDHFYLDYRHLWMNETMSPSEAQRKIWDQLTKLDAAYKKIYEVCWKQSISRKICKEFIEKYNYQGQVQKFFDAVNMTDAERLAKKKQQRDAAVARADRMATVEADALLAESQQVPSADSDQASSAKRRRIGNASPSSYSSGIKSPSFEDYRRDRRASTGERSVDEGSGNDDVSEEPKSPGSADNQNELFPRLISVDVQSEDAGFVSRQLDGERELSPGFVNCREELFDVKPPRVFFEEFNSKEELELLDYEEDENKERMRYNSPTRKLTAEEEEELLREDDDINQ